MDPSKPNPEAKTLRAPTGYRIEQRGPERFVVFLPDGSAFGTHLTAERARAAIDAHLDPTT